VSNTKYLIAGRGKKIPVLSESRWRLRYYGLYHWYLLQSYRLHNPFVILSGPDMPAKRARIAQERMAGTG
jgi:hypothetical protein